MSTVPYRTVPHRTAPHRTAPYLTAGKNECVHVVVPHDDEFPLAAFQTARRCDSSADSLHRPGSLNRKPTSKHPAGIRKTRKQSILIHTWRNFLNVRDNPTLERRGTPSSEFAVLPSLMQFCSRRRGNGRHSSGTEKGGGAVKMLVQNAGTFRTRSVGPVPLRHAGKELHINHPHAAHILNNLSHCPASTKSNRHP